MAFTAEAVSAEIRQHVSRVVDLAAERSRKEALTFAANLLHLPVGRVKRLFYGEVQCVPAHEADQIRAYVTAASQLIEARADYEARRQRFVAAHPALARLAPGPLEKLEIATDGKEQVTN
ncbi:MAG TPA: hypothetical protein VFW46_20110 [Stellaceae bacterium]|nr:hypothetical protein [Stellaceae bacterium]